MKRNIITFTSIIILIAGICGCIALISGKNTDGRCGMSRSEILEAADHWYDIESEQHTYIDYNDIEYTGIDIDNYNIFFEQFEKDISIPDNEDAVIADYNRLLDIFKEISGQYAIADLKYNGDVTNEKFAEDFSICEEQAIDMEDKSYAILRDALCSEYKDIISALIDNEEAVEDFLDYENMTDRERELDAQINDLKMEYYSVMQSDEHEYNGVVYSISEIENQFYDDKISYEEYIERSDAFTKGANKEVSEIYISLVKLLNEKAKLKGYDNYAEYGYVIYNRDYTIEDIKSVYSDVQTYIVPLYDEIYSRYEINDELYLLDLDEEAKLDRTEKIIKRIDPGLLMSWDYLRRYHMYDMNHRDTKADTGFTTSIKSHGSVFIFDSPYGYYEDVYTVVHEFGHYNNMFHLVENPLLSVSTLDVSETNSQGLEMLSLHYADVLFGKENAYDAQIYKLMAMMDSIISGCIFDEFQVAVFEYEGELTTETLNTIFHDIAVKYGRQYEEGETQDYEWHEVIHTFQSPMYYISYCTSGLAATDIFAMSVDDRQAAIDLYMNITTYPTATSIRELCEDTGLPDIFEQGTIEDISIAVRQYLVEIDNKKATERIVHIICIVIIVVLALLSLIILFIKVRRYYINRKTAGITLDEQDIK